MVYYPWHLFQSNGFVYHCVIIQTLQNGQTLGQFFQPLYLLDNSLIYLAGSWAPFIHIILSYVVSITWYITQPLVRMLLQIINPSVNMISFAQVCAAQWSGTVSSPNVWFIPGIHLTLFRFNNSNHPEHSSAPSHMYIWKSITCARLLKCFPMRLPVYLQMYSALRQGALRPSESILLRHIWKCPSNVTSVTAKQFDPRNV